MKIVLNDVASAANVSVINSNFQKIEDALNEQVLYRDNVIGEPNTMEDNLDMNGYRVYNLPKPIYPSEAVRLQDISEMIDIDEGLDVARFGAVGDGVTDDSDAIQRALDEANYLHFGNSNRNYKITKTLVVRSNTILDGRGASIFQVNSQTPLFDVRSTNTVVITNFKATGYTAVDVAAANLIAGKPYTIRVVGSTNWSAIDSSYFVGKVYDVGTYIIATGPGSGSGIVSTFYNRPSSKDIGIYADGAKNLIVYKNQFYNFNYSPLMVNSLGTNIRFEGNIVEGPGATTLTTNFRNCTGVTVVETEGVKIIGNTISKTSQGLIVGQGSRGVSVHLNHIRNTIVEHGMYIDTGVIKTSVTNNLVEDTALNGIKFQWYDGYPVIPQDLILSNNIVKNAMGGDGLVVLNIGLDAVATITGITKANPGVITTSAAHNLVPGDTIEISGVLGMTSINNTYEVNTTPTPTTLTVKLPKGVVDTTGAGFPAYTSGGEIRKPKYLEGLTMVGNIVDGAGQDGISLRYVKRGIVTGNYVKNCGRYGYAQINGIGCDVDNNVIVNTAYNGIFGDCPLEATGFSSNKLKNVCYLGDDTSGGSSGMYLQGDGGAAAIRNEIAGESTRTKMLIGLQVASGDKTQYSIIGNIISDAESAIISIHSLTNDPLKAFDSNFGTSATGPDALIGVPNMLPIKGSPALQYWSTAAPTSGTYQQGSRENRLYPLAGQPEGSVSTTSGSPGTWKARGIVHNVDSTTALTGTYTPTVTTVANCDLVTAGVAMYAVYGNLCIVSGTVTMDATAAAATTTWRMSLPIPSVLGGGNTNCSGTFGSNSTANQAGAIDHDGTNNAARFQCIAASASAIALRYTYTYVIA